MLMLGIYSLKVLCWNKKVHGGVFVLGNSTSEVLGWSEKVNDMIS
jgi:hypothetical protein